MAIVGDAEGELARLWTLVCELSEQLNSNKAVAASLQAQANALKVCLRQSSVYDLLTTLNAY